MSMLNEYELAQAASQSWYYSVELAPGLVAKGAYPANEPYVPRMLMRQATLAGMDCLELGAMEGLIPALMARAGARRVVAADAIPHCAAKMSMIQKAYSVNWEFREIGLMYDLHQKLAADGRFDYVNLSGVLYHVFSPLHTLASVRPLLKQNGIFVLSTNVVNEQSDHMHFNTAGALQPEINTFWYPSIPLLEYFLRYFNLLPIDCMYTRHASTNRHYVKGKECGAVCIVSRAVSPGAALPPEDVWARSSMVNSWEYLGLSPQKTQPEQEVRISHSRVIPALRP
jgi:2-polyprenyl-3-methyl-5-hydroxy-6-metoxy-1,4-benzoquinol methylase